MGARTAVRVVLVAKSTGIVLTATGISFANEWAQTDTPNFRVVMAGGAFSLLCAGIEEINKPVAVGLGTLMLITVLVTPFSGNSPMQELADLIANPNNAKGPRIKGKFKNAPQSSNDNSSGTTTSPNQQSGGTGTTHLNFPGGSNNGGSNKNPRPIIAP